MYYRNNNRNNNNLLYLLYIAVIAIICLWNINIVESAAIDAGSTSDSYCPYQQLPTNLNDLNYLGFNGEFHIHETYYYNFKNFQTRMDFEIKENSAFRIYVAPHVVDVDLWLYGSSSQSINHTTDTAGDESLYAELEAGKYFIKFLFFGQNKASKLDCKTISLEIAISPTKLMTSRAQGYKTCPTSEKLPNMDFSGLASSGAYTYDSDVKGDSLALLNTVYNQPYIFTKPITFTLPTLPTISKYGVDISVGFDFLTGGSLNILLISKDDDPTGNINDLTCYKTSKNCTIGIHSGKGHSIIKTVLLPGDYNIYFYDQSNEKDPIIQPPCLPFSFYFDVAPAHQLEDFLNCNEYVLPASFNEPGFIDDGGYMYFDEDVYLDLTVKNVIIPFTLTQPLSYFRTYIADFRIDIDVQLSSVKDDGTTTAIVSGFRFVGEEEIYAQIPNGKYQLKISYFGKNVDVFCEAYPLEVTIVPVTDFTGQCSGNNIAPDLGLIDQAIQTSQSFSLNTDPTKPQPVYQAPYHPNTPNTIQSENITSSVFTIPQDGNYYFESILESNFAVSNIRMVLVDNAEDGQSAIEYIGTHDRNRHLISSRLYPGQYTVIIETPRVNTKNQDTLPQCALYSLSIVIKQIPDGYTNEPSCLGIINQLPTNLNSPAYLGTSKHIHLSGDYLMPSLSIFTTKSTNHSFTVTEASMFRAYTPATSNVDIDFNLYEDDKLVSWNTKFYKEEPMLYQLKANSKYSFVIKFYHFAFSAVPDCSTFYLELAIGPIKDNPNDQCGSALQNIPNDLIPNASTKQFYKSSQYNFNQNATSASIVLPFSVPANVGMAEFRAFLTYDFLWNNLALQLVSASSKNVITTGAYGYNYHDIELIQLPAGDYQLIIYEPFPNTKTSFNLRNCVEYVLDVGLQLVDDGDLQKDTVVCPWLMLPASFDSLGYKSQLTSNSLYYQETVLADVFNKKDSVTFSVATKSLFRAYVPSHPLIDVNILLYTGSGSLVKSDKTVIFLELKPDKYVLTFQYSAGSNGPLPKIEDCPSYDAFVSIVPTTDFIANPVIADDCPVSAPAPPNVVQPNTAFTQSFYRDMSLQPTPIVLTFSTSNYSHIYVNVDYNDLVAPLTLSLDGSANILGKIQQRSYDALYQGGEAFINEVIPEGNWTLTLVDAFKSPSPNSNVQCAPYSLSYLLKTDNVVPTCENLAQLPSDISVGNYPYGGRQSATGEIRLSAPFILIPQQSTPIRVSFINPTTTSFMRILAKTDYKNDITFKIFSGTSSEPIYTSSIKTSIDNNVWKLDPSPKTPYVLEISTTGSKNDINCNYFSFDMAIDNIDTVEKGLLCPVPALNEAKQVPPFQMTIENGKDYSVSSADYYFTSKRIQQNSINGMFTYVITLDVKGPILLSTSVGFDFLVNDLNIALYNVSANKIDIPFTTGSNSIMLDDNSEFDIYNSIKTPLGPGSYHLVISQDMNSNSFGIPNYCRFFAFSLAATSTFEGLAPRITDAQPPTQVNMYLNSDFKVTVTFSEKFAPPVAFANVAWPTYLKNSQAIYLINQDTDTNVFASSALAINQKTSSLVLNFAQKDLVAGVNYQLFVDATKFVSDATKVAFTNKTGTLPHYRFLDCQCSGDHGTCSSDGKTCTCNGLWDGSDCSKCKAGYHGVGTECVKNVPCTTNTCNGNGVCSDASGYPECTCKAGYSSTQDNLCGVCAYGYTGYPKCTLEQENQPTYCYAPILPQTLNSIEYLLFENNVHIQDNYYLDITAGSHEIFFTLTEASMLRVYTEPHEMDVDLWLYNATDKGEMVNSIDRSITFNHEEVILSSLAPGHYIIAFKYYNWARIVDSCPTFNLELAIDTIASLQDNTKQTLMCVDQNGKNRPSSTPGTDAIPAIITANFAYDSPTEYLLFVEPTNKAVYLWNTTFTVKPAEDGKVVMADIEISYQFLPGDLSLLIQAGDSKTIKCKGSTDTADSGCVYGDNELNRNVIHATLIPGVYTLWIYAPEFSNSSNMNCAPFNFKSSFTMINDDEDYFNCEGEILPASLNNPQFLVDNYIHLQDLYLVDTKHSDINFTLTEKCVIRVSGEQDDAIVLVSLIGPAGKVLSKDTSVFHMELASGAYTLHIETNIIANAKNFCPLLNLEIAIEPSDTPIRWKPTCPTVKTAPQISARIPFIFENGTKDKEVFYVPTDSPRIVGSYSITLTQTSQFYAAIASEFLRGDLRVNLYKVLADNTQMLFVPGAHDYNYNWIQEDLEPGRYTFNIERPQIKVVGGVIPECIPYEFEFTILPMSKLPMCPGESIPQDWNSVRFLGTEGKLHYQSDNFVVPQGKFTQVNIPITVDDKSVIRIYVNPHIVDVDIHLIDPFTNKSLASGSNGINTEESFVYLMERGHYFVNLQFWKWSKSIPDCTTFSMEIAVELLSDIVKTPNCANGGSDFWPTIPSSFKDSSYSFNSLDSGIQYYFQQATAGSGLKSKSFTFTTSTATNVHFQVGFNFLTGDLALKLVSNAKNKKVYYGTIAPNRNVLEIVNLPAGSYNLVIYEPYSSLDEIMGCSFFNFDFYMEQYVDYNQIDGFYHYLPSTLDSYAYLNYNWATHLQGEYMMFDGVQAHNNVPFTVVKDPAFVRVQATVVADDEVNNYNSTMTPVITIKNMSAGKNEVSRPGSVAILLQPGQYSIVFGQGLRILQNRAVDVELAIATQPQTQKSIDSIKEDKNCANTQSIDITPSPVDGSFYFRETLKASYDKMKQPGIVLQSTFKIKQPTSVYAQVGYQFLLGDMDLYITSDDITTINLQGRGNRNTNEINVILPAGSYILTIVNPVNIPDVFGQHCTPYSLSLTLRNASSTTHSDCSLFNSIPWDLNSKTGGSAEFGGPMDLAGNLRFYSDDFIAPSTSSTQNMTFKVSRPTFVNIFTTDDLVTTISSDIFVHNTNDDQTLLYDIPLNGNTQRSALYVAETNGAGAPKSFDIQLAFKGKSRDSCPAFEMQVVMKPVSYIRDQLYCPTNYQQILPSTSPIIDANGNFNEYIESTISGDFINSKTIGTTNNQFEYYVDFRVTRASRLASSISFDSIVTNFYLRLAIRNTDKNGKVIRSFSGNPGEWTAETSNGETSMTSMLNRVLQPGNYSLVIVQPKFEPNSYLSASLYGELCFPFSYSLSIMDKNQVTAGTVTPPNGYKINPTLDLSLTFESQSTFYDSNKNQILCDQTSYMQQSFYLASKTSSDRISPSNVVCSADDGTKWLFTFSSESLVPSNSYVLSLSASRLFDSNAVQAILPPQNVYSMLDTSCSNNGVFSNGICNCASAYSGFECDTCANNYYNIGGHGDIVCVSNRCSNDYCGCDPNNNSTCTALGKCQINANNDAICLCSKPYNGTTCNTCAAGYRNWPYCTIYKDCGDCGKGSCNHDTGVCSCPSNYQGQSCSECAEGYSGSDCKKNGSGAIIALEVIGSLVVVSIVIGVGIWFIRTRYRTGVTRYKMLPKFDFDNDNDRSTQFPGLYDDDEPFDSNTNNNNKSINSEGGKGKAHVFSFSSMPSSAVDSDDDDDYEQQQKIQALNQKNNHLFDM